MDSKLAGTGRCPVPHINGVPPMACTPPTASSQLGSSIVLALAATVSGCTYSVHQASLGGLQYVPRGAHVRVIEAEASDFVVLGFGGGTEFVDRAWRQLLELCVDGEIVAVESRQSTALRFLSYEETILLTGLCVDGPAADAAAPTDGTRDASVTASR